MRRLFSIALAVLMCGGYGCPWSIAASTQETGKAPIDFERREDLGYVVRFGRGAQPFGGSLCGLISVDGKDLSKFTESEVKGLLVGPVGSSLTVEYMSPDGKTGSRAVTRELVASKPMFDHNGLLYSNYDNRSGGNFNGAFVQDSLDIEARATQNLLIRTVKEWPEEARGNNLSPLMFSTAIVNYEVGDIADGDHFLKLSNQEYSAGQRWFPFQNRQMGKALNVLSSVGRLDAAQRAVSQIADGGTLGIFQADDVFKALAQAQVEENKQDAAATVEKYLRVKGAGVRSSTWAARVFEQVGDYRRAQETYSQLIGPVLPGERWEGLQPRASLVFENSYLQYKLGDKTAAIAGLQDMIAKIKTNLPAEEIALIEKMPGVFPRLSELQLALQAVEEGAEFPQHPQDSDVAPRFPNIRACHDAIKRGDKSEATRLIYSFLDQYRGNVPEARVSGDRQNLYCCILTLAREISDQGWLNISDDVLHRLKNEAYGKDASTMTASFLQAELVFNASREKKLSDEQWHEFEAIYHATMQPKDGSRWRDFAWSERLRRLAVVFYYAGELKRAEFFIGQALSQREEEIGHSADVTHYNGPLGEKTMMLLDAACIAAKQGQFDEAEDKWNQAMSLAPLSQDGYRYTIIELCSVYVQNNRREKAIAMLGAVRSKPVYMRLYQLNNGVTALDLYLAQLLFASGKPKEAKEIADAAAEKMPQRLYWPQVLVVAQCDEACGDYAQAAKYYANRPWTSSPILFADGDYTPWLEKALMLADKVPDFDKAALAKICCDLAERKGYQHPQEAAALYKRACDLTADSDPAKPARLSRLAQLERYIQPQNAATAAKSEQSTSIARKNMNLLKMQEDAAALAEQNHLPNARSLWLQFAEQEVWLGQIKKGLEHEHHAMNLYTAQDAMRHEGVLGHSDSFTNGLVNKGHKDEAERLLIQAVARTKAVAGQSSVATQAQLTDLFSFYVQQGKKPEALKILDQILQFNLKTGETLSQSLMHSHCGSWPMPADAVEVLGRIARVLVQMKAKDLQFSRTVFERVLKAQRSQLKEDDERLRGTISQLGDIYFELGRYSEADKYYSEAYALSSKYHSGEFAVRLAGKNYLANLRKIGKEAAADRLARMDWEGVRPPKR